MRKFLIVFCLFAVLTGCGAKPEPEPAADATFADIAGHPMEEQILEGLRRGLYAVPPDGRFRPDEPATRGEFLTALWNLSGRPGDAESPDEPVTRQEAMSILYADNGSVSGVEAMLTGIYDSGFRDSDQIPPGGKAALYWGFYNVLIREPEPDMIDPSGTVSRGDMADIMIRYADTFRGESPENSIEEESVQ